MQPDETYADLRRHATEAREPFYDIALRYRRAELPTLDIGAGSGSFADRLGDPAIHLIEGSPGNAAALKARYPNTVEMVLPGRLPYEDATFGLVHCSHLVEHLQPSALHELLVEIDRVLAPGGHFVVSAPLLADGFYGDMSHVKPYDPFVFEKYLCDVENPGMVRTRDAVSGAYRTVELAYRYRFVPLPHFTIGFRPSWAQKALHWLCAQLRKRRAGWYQRSGFTLVLQKRRAGA